LKPELEGLAFVLHRHLLLRLAEVRVLREHLERALAELELHRRSLPQHGAADV
jgi:hypothetical protein